MGEYLNIKNQWGGDHKKGGIKFWNFIGGKQKGGDTIFDSNLVGGGEILEETVLESYNRKVTGLNPATLL